MSQTLEEKRIAELTERIEDFLCEGEAFIIRREEDELEVLPAQKDNPIRRNHEELYGLMLSLNQQLAEAASLPRWVVRLMVLSLILALHLEWLSGLPLPIDFAKLQNYWVYGLIFLLGFAINSTIKEWCQHQIYARRRGELMRQLQDSGLPKYQALTQMEGEPALSEVSHMLKRDHAQEARF
jgi:hypothetical protein